MKNPLSVNFPFPGFYESALSGEIDRQAEYFAEHEADEGQEDCPAELRLDASEIADILFDVTSYRDCYRAAAKTYFEYYCRLYSDETGIEINDSKFEEMTSPREYNFTTDRIFGLVPRKAIADMLRTVRREEYSYLESEIKSRFTSYDGFLSGYSNRLSDWLAKPVSDWDHNEIGTLLLAAARANGFDPDSGETTYQIIDDCPDGFCREWESGVDFAKYDEKVKEAHEGKRAELLSEDPEWIAPYRCPETLDLFA